MIDPFTIIFAIKQGLSDPNRCVLQEIESRRPGFKREQTFQVIGLWVISALLLLGLFMGWAHYP